MTEQLEVTVTDDELRDAAEVQNDVAFDLLRELDEGENLIIGPTTINNVLAMMAAGSGGSTREAFERLYGPVDEDFHRRSAGLDQMLRRASTDGASVRPASQVWAQDGFPFEHDYLDVLTGFYGAPLATLDIAADPGGAAGEINEWVSDATEGRIPTILTGAMLAADVRMVLVSAVHFDGSWEREFDPDLTRPQTFHLADGSTIETPLMGQDLSDSPGFEWARDAETTAVVLPYRGDELEMLVVVPEDRSTFLAGLDQQAIASIDANLVETTDLVAVAMPPFEFETDLDLEPAVGRLGLDEMFTPSADFSGVSPEPLEVGFLVHRAWVRVDEQGTEAAAATAGGLEEIGGPIDPPAFRADRPFLFLIRHADTGLILFAGQITDPSQALLS